MRPSWPGLRRALQLTLAIVKPDAVAHPLVLEAVHETILSHKFLIVRTKDLLWSREDSRRFYQEHSDQNLGLLALAVSVSLVGMALSVLLDEPAPGRFFYRRLVEFMSSGPLRVYILAHEEAVSRWRSLMGPTKVYRARHTAPGSIRGTLGLTDTRNTVHGSDSAASASKEIAFFFPDFNEEEWYQREEPQLCRETGGPHVVLGCNLKDS